MNTTGPMMSISSAIADFPHLELALVVALVGWVATSWILRRGTRKHDS